MLLWILKWVPLNYYMSILFPSACDFKFMKSIVQSQFSQIVFAKILGVYQMLKVFQELKYSVFKETWETLQTI